MQWILECFVILIKKPADKQWKENVHKVYEKA